VIGFVVEVEDESGWTEAARVDAGVTTVRLRGIAHPRQARVAVRAVNAFGASERAVARPAE
jgi:hypothetical protein